MDATTPISFTARCLSIFSAACNGAAADVRSLVRNRLTPVDLVDSSGKSALHHAAYCNQGEVSQVLLEEGASPEVADLQGMVPLHDAAASGSQEIVKVRRPSFE